MAVAHATWSCIMAPLCRNDNEMYSKQINKRYYIAGVAVGGGAVVGVMEVMEPEMCRGSLSCVMKLQDCQMFSGTKPR